MESLPMVLKLKRKVEKRLKEMLEIAFKEDTLNEIEDGSFSDSYSDTFGNGNAIFVGELTFCLDSGRRVTMKDVDGFWKKGSFSPSEVYLYLLTNLTEDHSNTLFDDFIKEMIQDLSLSVQVTE